MKPCRFTVKFDNHEIVGDIFGQGKPTVLFLHGAGKGDRTRFIEMREIMLKYGVTSAAFDFIGHGETGGNIKETSLKSRTDQALAVIKHLKIRELDKLIGLSMSGYTAIKLTEHLLIEKLVLIVPAVYRADVYETKFNAGFTGQIREDESWKKSDAWKILNEFKREVLIIKAEKDETIPEGVISKLFNSAKHSSCCNIYEVKHSPHKVMLYCKKFPWLFGIMVSEIDEDIYDRCF